MTLDPHRLAIQRNRQAWNDLAESGAALARPASDEDFTNPADAVDPQRWLRDRLHGGLHGKRVLCLAAGGGRQGPLFAATGAQTTVVDLSEAMLARDEQVASQRGLQLRVLRESMDGLTGLRDEEFDVVAQPVSTCYVPDVHRVYAEVARVLKPGGLYLSQHKTPTSLQAKTRASEAGLLLETPYYTDRPLPESPPCRTREPGTTEYLHRWEELLGGMCAAGMSIEALSEPSHAEEPGEHGKRSRYVAPYVRVLARRNA